ncbi:MAG TPA: glycosyltransferase [Candidatus Deferrimicrobiaceae bacterium]|jgi:glycosyltransferase involved in cell wall biosynthesis
MTRSPRKPERPRLGVIASHFIQYQAPIWRELAKREEIDLTVYYLSDHGRRPGFDAGFGHTFQWDVPLDQGYRWELLPGAEGTSPGSLRHRMSLEPIKKALAGTADVFLRNDYNSPGALLFFYACMARGIPVLYRGDSTLLHESPGWRSWKRMILGPLFRNGVMVLSVGKLVREYTMDLGAPPDRIVSSPHNVDTPYWEEAASRRRPERDRIREGFGLPPARPVVLFCGKLIEKKRPMDLAEAMCRLSERREVSLLVAGAGDLLEPMKAAVSGVPGLSVHFAGFVNQSGLPDIYAVADIVCLPSGGDETWGLVVNEAMHFGCVPVVSDRVGCGPDLVEGIGESFSAGDPVALASAIGKVLDGLEERKSRVPSRIGRYSLARAVDGIVEGALRSTNRSGAHAGTPRPGGNP